jgi:hypothetical protein
MPSVPVLYRAGGASHLSASLERVEAALVLVNPLDSLIEPLASVSIFHLKAKGQRTATQEKGSETEQRT